MDTLINIINNDYQDILMDKKNPKYHLFFESINWWKGSFVYFSKSIKEHVTKKISNEYKYISDLNLQELQEKIVPVEECKYVIKKTIKKETLIKLYELISDFKTDDINVIKLAFEKMYDYNLPSTIKNIKNWKKKESSNSNETIINVLIMGAGPLGLFTALYLNNYYNREGSKSILNFYVNILVIDNRIYKEGIKKPYTRATQFGFDIEQIQPFIKQIFCWKNFGGEWKRDRRFDFISVLENLLYVTAYHENISMYFTKKFEDFKDIKTFVKDENIHYVFDCTGGRLKNTDNLKHDMIWNKYKFKKDKNEVKFNDETQYFEYNENNKVYTKTIVVLELLDKNMKHIKVGNRLGYSDDINDILLINKFKNMCLLRDDYIELSKYFKSESLRYLFPAILNICKKWKDSLICRKLKFENIKYIKITTFNSIARHAPFAATKINKNSTYIKLGDSLGATEFGIKYGMWTSILFSKHICNLLSSVKYF